MKKLFLVYQIMCMSTYLIAGFNDDQEIFIPSSFDEAMISDQADVNAYTQFLKKTPHKRFFNLIINQYYQFLEKARIRKSDELSIPKIIHQIWIGPHEFPKDAREWQESWLALHPDWEYKLWTNEDVDKLEFKNKKYFDEAENWGEKSDILRYEILYRFGGLYVDVDFACIKPLDWLHHTCDFYAGIHVIPLLLKNRLRINNGLIAARPNHPILAHALEQIPHYRDKLGVALRTGPDFFTSVIGDVLPNSCATGSIDMIFPSNFFYPSGPMNGHGFTIEPGEAYIQPETLAVHYYTGYWIRPPEKKEKNESKVTYELRGSQVRPCGNPERMTLRYQQYKAKAKVAEPTRPKK